MTLNNYNNLLTSVRWYNKNPKDYQILYLVGLSQKLVDDSKKSSEKYNRYSTKLEPAYIKYLPPCMLEVPKWGVGNKTNDGK